MRRSRIAALCLIAVAASCGESEKKTSKDGASAPTQQAKSSEVPRLTRVQERLDEYVRLLEASAEELNKVSDKETAASAADKLKKNAQRVDELAQELRAIGHLTREENKQISAKGGLKKAHSSYSEANKKVEGVLASGQLPAEADQALRDALGGWGKANLAFSLAVLSIAPPKAASGDKAQTK